MASLATLKKRVEALEAKLPAPPKPSPEEERRQKKVWSRLNRMLKAASPLITAEEAEPIDEALRKWNEEGRGAFATWFQHLDEGRSRLPELPPQTFKDLLLAFVSPDRDDFTNYLCRACGMEWPRHKSPPTGQMRLLPGRMPFDGLPPPWYEPFGFFLACPSCGGSAYLPNMTWAHLPAEGREPWMDLEY